MQAFTAGYLSILVTASAACGQLHLIGQFNPSHTAGMISIGYNPVGERIAVHTPNSAAYQLYNRSGVYQGFVFKPFRGGNQDGIEFATIDITLNGTHVPVGSLLSIEHTDNPPRVIAMDLDDGATIGTVTSDPSLVGKWFGGSHHAATNSFYALDRSRVTRVDLNNGALLEHIPTEPPGSSEFRLLRGDCDVLEADGNIYIVSEAQTLLRVISTSGELVGDFDLSNFGIHTMSGIAFDDARGEAWICTSDGLIYQLGGFNGLDGCRGDIADDSGTLGAQDGQVSFGDFLAMLSLVGPCGNGVLGCEADIANEFGVPGADGVVDFGDFIYLLSQTGPCI